MIRRFAALIGRRGGFDVALSTNTAAGTSSSSASPPAQQASGGERPLSRIDARSKEEMKIASSLGEEGFEENTRILKHVAGRGLRAFVIFGAGVGAFAFAMRQQKLKAEGARPTTDEDDDPTERYLEEMRGLGFDVDTLEEELEMERKSPKSS